MSFELLHGNARIHGHGAFFESHHRIEVQLLDLGKVRHQPGEALDQVRQGGLVQVGIILGLGAALFSVTAAGSFWALLVVTVVFILAILSLGLVLSTFATNQLQAMQMTVFILMPSILLSGFMFPYEGMPAGAQAVADLLPATHFMRTIRGVVLRDAGLPEVLPEALWMLGFALLGLGLASIRFRKRLD